MTKRLLSALLALVITLSAIPLFSFTASAASAYNYKKALKYADAHWNDRKGLCAEFVSDCLKAGGVKEVYETSVINLYNNLQKKNLGKVYKLKLTGGKRGYIKKSDNEGKLKAGDPIFYRCNYCKRYTHVVICNGFNSDGYALDYAHNNPHNGKKRTSTYPHCGSNSWSMYSIRMNEDGLLCGEKTKVETPIINEYSIKIEGVQVQWDKIEGEATTYRVYRKLSGKSWVFMGETDENTFVDTTAENGKTYLYTVRAVQKKIRSQYHEGIKIKFTGPTAFKSAESDGKYITLAWKANTSADGYCIYRKVDKGGWKRYKDIVGNKTVKFTDTKVSEGKTYQYRIYCFDGAQRSGCDPDGIKAEVIKAPKLKGLSNQYLGVKLSWYAVDKAVGYRVYRRSDDNKKWMLLDTVEELFYIDSTAKSGKKYRYTVRSVSALNRGGFDTKGVSRLYLETPQFTATSTHKGIELKWKKVVGAKGYYIYQKKGDAKNWKQIATVKSIDKYLVKNAVLNESYTYTIRAYNGKILGSFIPEGVKCIYNPYPQDELPPVTDAPMDSEAVTEVVPTTEASVEKTEETIVCYESSLDVTQAATE